MNPILLPALFPVIAYIGPGAGLSALGALLALGVGLCVAFVAFIWYPVRRIRRKLRARPAAPGTSEGGGANRASKS